MKGLLIVAHGSRREGSNDEVRRLAEGVTRSAGATFEKVGCAFLELTTPLIGPAMAALVAEGVTDLVVFPLFLAAGTHVIADIPQIVAEEAREHSQLSVTVLPHLGAVEGLGSLIVTHVASHLAGER